MSNWKINEKGALSYAQMQHNASIVQDELSRHGWTVNAISALLGNMQVESGINPARWEGDKVGNYSGGFGLVQWTPATKLMDWIESTYDSTDYSNGDYQLFRILYELDNGLQYGATSAFPLSFREWSTSKKSPAYLAAAFMVNYERPADQSKEAQKFRGKLAKEWYFCLTGKHWVDTALLCILAKQADRRLL